MNVNLVNKQIKIQVLLSFGIKALSLIVNFLLVPLTISYVGIESYGIWLVLSSIIAWFSMFDMGLGHGLRNRLSQSIANSNLILSREYISTAYLVISLISVFIIILFLALNNYLDWNLILNTEILNSSKLSEIAILTVLFFCLQFVLRLITIILTANSLPIVSSAVNLVSNIVILGMLYIAQDRLDHSLLQLVIIYSAPSTILLFVLSVLLFSSKYRAMRPSITHVKVRHMHKIMGLGSKFFFLQLEVLVIFQVTNIIITQLFGLTEVAIFNIVYKYFGTIQIIFAIIMNVYWSEITKAIEKNNLTWVKVIIQKMKIRWYYSIPIAITMLIFSDIFYKIWLSDNYIAIPFVLSLTVCVFVLVASLNSIYEYSLNGAGKLGIMMISAVISVVIYVPLVYVNVKIFGFGVEGVVLAMILLQLINVLVLPMQLDRFLNKKTTGIWDR